MVGDFSNIVLKDCNIMFCNPILASSPENPLSFLLHVPVFHCLSNKCTCLIPYFVLPETDSEVEMSHSDDSDIVGSISWTGPLHDIDPGIEETMSADVFTLPQPHRSFKEYVGNKTDLSRAVIPAAILAGYTGEFLHHKWFCVTFR